MTDILSILSRLDWKSVIDILLVSVIFFWLFTIIRGTHAVPLLRGVVIVVIIVVVVTNVFQLTAVSWLARNSLPALLVAIPVVFQPELRRLLERLGRSTGGFLSVRPRETAMRQMIEVIAQACAQLSLVRHGALMVIERDTGLQDIIETGVTIDAEVSRELLQTIFYPNTSLHDGAAIIRAGRIVAASCVLPLSTSVGSVRELGTRHRAALGITESSDAIAIVVSEETGVISITQSGRIIRPLDKKRLINVLTAFFRPQYEGFSGPEWFKRLRRSI